jgi:serralysin
MSTSSTSASSAATSIYLDADGVILPLSGAYTTITSSAQSVTGNSGNDGYRTNGTGQTVALGSGNDTYFISSANDVVLENPNGGIDTVVSTVNYTLAANVENLTLQGPAWYGAGNNLDNIITAGNIVSTLNGEGGSNVLIAGTAADTFVVDKSSGGSDSIVGFKAASDVVQLSGFGWTSFSQVQAAMTQVGADVVLSLPGSESVVLRNQTISNLHASNFQLGLDMSHLQVTFDDEMNSLSLWNGTSGTWRTQYGYGGVNSEDSRAPSATNVAYVDSTFMGSSGTTPLGVNPFSINDGVLTITAAPASATVSSEIWDKGYTSGSLNTKMSFSQEYGYFDIRAKLPAGQGFFPAFWLLPENGSWPPEIDIFEQLSKDPDTLYMSTLSGQTGSTVTVHNLVHVDNATTEFHDYGLLWTATQLTWYVDGVAVATEATPADMNTPMYMIMNLAVGGSWAGAADGISSSQMEIDYVRAYSLSQAAVANPLLLASMTDSSSGSSTTSTSTSTSTTSSAGSTTSGTGATAVTYVAPVAKADAFTVTYGSAKAITVASLTANDTVTSGYNLTVTGVSGAQHGTVSLVNGVVTFTPYADFDGTASFQYTISDGHGGTATGTATVAVTGSTPVYIYDAGSTAAKTVDFTGDAAKHQYVAGSGATTIYMGSGGGSVTLGAGADTVYGGAGKEMVTFGTGIGTVTGGGGGDTYVLVKGHIAQSGASYDTVTDFHGAGRAMTSGSDFLWLSGFSKSATVAYEGDVSGQSNMHLYQVTDGSYHADFVLEYSGAGVQLNHSEYGFL